MGAATPMLPSRRARVNDARRYVRRRLYCSSHVNDQPSLPVSKLGFLKSIAAEVAVCREPGDSPSAGV